MQFGLTLILAGAAGNLYDRFAYGYVVDSWDFYIGADHWPAFNVADSCITIGAGCCCLIPWPAAPAHSAARPNPPSLMCPRLFTIGSFSVPTYGLLVALGFLVGLMIVGRLSRRVGLDPDTMTNLGIYVALAAIVGAKVFMILSNLGYYIESPGRIFSLSSLQAGGVFYGGLLGALAVAVWYSRRASLPPLQTADVLAPAVAIGHSIGRLGCFAAGCCWGKETDLPWGVVFTNPIAHDLSACR